MIMIRKKIFFFVVILKICKKPMILEEDLRKKINSLNSDVNVSKIAYYKKDRSILFFLFIKMNNNIEVEYTVANNSIHAIEPKKTAIGSAGCGLFPAE